MPLIYFEVTSSPEFNVFFSVVLNFAFMSVPVRLIVDVFRKS